MTPQYLQKQTYIKRISSVEELESYLQAKTDLNHYAFVGYIWQEYGFFPIYFNELFTEFFNDCKDSLVIGTCFAGHEIFYQGKVDELLILDGFIDTQRAYMNGKETKLLKQRFAHHEDRTIAFWYTIRNFNEDRFQGIINQFNFEKELFSIGKKTIWAQQLHPGPHPAKPYQYARGTSEKKYWLPENINRWQTERTLGWNLQHWNPAQKHPKVIQGSYCAIFVKNSFKTEEQDYRKGFGRIDNDFLQTIIKHFIRKKQKLVVIHDLLEYDIDENSYIEQVRMVHYFDTQYYLSIAHHADIFISSATSPIDLAAYYCNSHLVLLDDRGKKFSWIEKVSQLRGKQCLESQSRTSEDATNVIAFIDSLFMPNELTNLKHEYQHTKEQNTQQIARLFERTNAIKTIKENSQSQIKQDIFVLLETQFKHNGFFVEFGATDGITLSNTFLLEKQFNWSGILSEPAKTYQDALKENRQAGIDYRCVWNATGKQLTFNEAREPEFSTIVEFNDHDKHEKRRAQGYSYSVETISLMDLLKQHQAPKVIDYLSIDTEGSELDILEAFDFNAYHISIISCEHNFTDNREKIYNLLTSYGYERKHTELSQWDDWYVKIK